MSKEAKLRKEALLTMKEINKLPHNPLSGLPCPPVVARKQLSKAYPIFYQAGRAEAFKEVGEVLIKVCREEVDNQQDCRVMNYLLKALEALKSGKPVEEK